LQPIATIQPTTKQLLYLEQLQYFELANKVLQSQEINLSSRRIAPQDLKPSDILIERFVAWKANDCNLKQLIACFEVRFLLTFHTYHRL
jgi:hypothetical protein